MREDYRAVKDRVAARSQERERLLATLTGVYEQLPVPLRSSVALKDEDWLATRFPEPSELQSLKTEVAQLPDGRENLQKIREQLAKQDTLRGQAGVASTRLEVLRAGLADEPATLRRQHALAEAESNGAAAKVRAVRDQLVRTRAEADEQEERRRACASVVTDLDNELRTLRLQEAHDRQLLQAAVAALPELWRPVAERAKLAEQNALKAELDTLLRSGVEARAAELARAKSEGETLRARRVALVAAEALVPSESRVTAAAAGLQLAESRRTLAERDEELPKARAALSVLENRRRQRHELSCEYLAREGEWKTAKLLADLLDRNHLQRHLVRSAERQVVEYANTVLDRLSAGQLALRLRGGEDDAPDKALELEAYHRETGRDAIGVAFLSGSQRFRVAVALALGIGQYASRRHRPIESVIIDEGFGCLDRVGRQAMIQEMQNLRGHLKCVILVSHQEEFAEAFPHAYHFELVDGATRVSPVVR